MIITNINTLKDVVEELNVDTNRQFNDLGLLIHNSAFVLEHNEDSAGPATKARITFLGFPIWDSEHSALSAARAEELRVKARYILTSLWEVRI